MTTYKSIFQTRVLYAYTDQMGFVYHAHYVVFYEMGRVEFLRERGIRYRDIEKGGILMPVVQLEIKYLKPAYYDEMLTIETQIDKIPKGPSFSFSHRILNENAELINQGKITLVLLDAKSKKTVTLPDWLMDKFQESI